MSKAQFQVVLTGPSIINREIDAPALSAAVMALHLLLEEADTILNDGRTEHRLRILNNFQEGSFKVDFTSTQTIVQKTLDILKSGEVDAVLNALEISDYLIYGVPTGVASLLYLIRKLRGKKPSKIEELKNDRCAVYYNKEEIITHKKIMRLYESITIRKKAEMFITDPMNAGKFNKIEFKRRGRKSFVISQSEADYYRCPAEEKIEGKVWTETISLYIVKVSFKEGNKWDFHDGHAQLTATIEDEAFINSVNKSDVAFRKGDILRADVRCEQYRTETGLKKDYYIEKVLKHIESKGTVPLF